MGSSFSFMALPQSRWGPSESRVAQQPAGVPLTPADLPASGPSSEREGGSLCARRPTPANCRCQLPLPTAPVSAICPCPCRLPLILCPPGRSGSLQHRPHPPTGLPRRPRPVVRRLLAMTAWWSAPPCQLPLPLPLSTAHVHCPCQLSLSLPSAPAICPCPCQLPLSTAPADCPLPTVTAPVNCPCQLSTAPANCQLPLPTVPARAPLLVAATRIGYPRDMTAKEPRRASVGNAMVTAAAFVVVVAGLKAAQNLLVPFFV